MDYEVSANKNNNFFQSVETSLNLNHSIPVEIVHQNQIDESQENKKIDKTINGMEKIISEYY